ncbi:hypothetical protein Tco_0536452 [Tanacetum coccineum]
MTDSEGSAVIYTLVYTDSEPGRVFWGTDEEPVPQDEDEREPRFIESDPKRDPEYEDDEEQDGPVNCPMGEGDDGGDDDGDSSGDDIDDKDEDIKREDE